MYRQRESMIPINLFPNEKRAIMEFAERLRQRLTPLVKEVILFGSKVKGNAEKDSDIDILIVLDKLSVGIKKTISDIAAEENLKYNVLIATVRYDSDTWENPIIKSSPFGRVVRKEGIRL